MLLTPLFENMRIKRCCYLQRRYCSRYGITDLDIIADAGKSSEEKVENFRYLTSEERVENVMKQAEYFGYSGDRVKGLILCRRIDAAK